MANNKPIIFFDASRLFNRLLSSTPAGIDRVDLAYAKKFLHDQEYTVAYIVYGKKGHFIFPRLIVILFLWVAEFSSRNRDAKFSSRVAFPLVTSLVAYFLRPSNFLWILKFFRWMSVLGLPRHPESIISKSTLVAVYINVSHGKLTKYRRFSWLKDNNVSGVFFVHDLIPILNPEFCTDKQAERHRARLEMISQHADLIISISENTKEELVRYFSKEKLSLPEIQVLPLAVDGICHANEVKPVIENPTTYFVILSTIEPRKNHLMLLKIWKRLVKDFGLAAPKLVIIGRRGWKNDKVFRLLEDKELEPYVHEYNDLSDGQVKSLLLGSRALISPSFVEGYGLPVVEALSLKVPVIASDIPSHREIGKSVPDFIDPYDAESWYAHIVAYTDSENTMRASQLERMSDFSIISWKEHMLTFDKLLKELVVKKSVVSKA